MIRQATLQDIASIASLIKSEPGQWQDEWADDVIERALKSSDGLAFVWHDTETLGFICCHDVGFRGYISELLVVADYRRKKIGSQLVAQVEKELYHQGCHIVIADIWCGADQFFESLGWVSVSPNVSLKKKELRSP